MKIALIQTPVWGTREPPVGVVQLAGELKSKGITTKSFDLNNFLYRNVDPKHKDLWAWEQVMFWYKEKEVSRFFEKQSDLIQKFVENVLNFEPDIIGFSVFSSTFYSSLNLTDIFKKEDPNLKIIFGGQTFYDYRFIEESFKKSKVDFIIKGEGEITFVELIRNLERKKNIYDCNGIYLKDGNNIRFTGERKDLVDLNKLAYMDFSDLKIEDYDDSEHIAIMSSRGCVWNCVFCSSRNFWGKYRFMRGERIHQEISFHRKNYPKLQHIDFFDLMFNGNIKRIVEFAELIVRYPPYDPNYKIYWVANAGFLSGMTKDVLEILKKSGCKRLIFGVESGSQKILKKMKKPYRTEVAKRILKDCYEVGIKTTCNFMFGFPGEAEEDFNETLNFIKDAGKYISRVYPSRTYCALEEHSYFYQHPEEFGIKVPFNHHLYWETYDGKNTYPVRLERCKRFEKLCYDMGIEIDCGVKIDVELDNYYNLGEYYEYKGDKNKALDYYFKYLKIRNSEVVKEKIKKLNSR